MSAKVMRTSLSYFLKNHAYRFKKITWSISKFRVVGLENVDMCIVENEKKTKKNQRGDTTCVATGKPV